MKNQAAQLDSYEINTNAFEVRPYKENCKQVLVVITIEYVFSYRQMRYVPNPIYKLINTFRFLCSALNTKQQSTV